MLFEDHRGSIALHAFPDGVYVVTDGGARLLRDTADLEERLAAICRRFLDGPSAGEREPTGAGADPVSLAGSFVAWPGGAVAFETPTGRHRLNDEPELVRLLAAECRRAVPASFTADAWELD